MAPRARAGSAAAPAGAGTGEVARPGPGSSGPSPDGPRRPAPCSPSAHRRAPNSGPRKRTWKTSSGWSLLLEGAVSRGEPPSEEPSTRQCRRLFVFVDRARSGVGFVVCGCSMHVPLRECIFII